jgi:hypothetical protein
MSQSENIGCKDCRFWQRGFPQKAAGRCRRNPPVIVDSLVRRDDYGRDDVTDATMFPITDEADWCGEYRHKDRG